MPPCKCISCYSLCLPACLPLRVLPACWALRLLPTGPGRHSRFSTYVAVGETVILLAPPRRLYWNAY